jgi:AcrR family transcriptional regulator
MPDDDTPRHTTDETQAARRQARIASRRDRSREEILDATRRVLLRKGVGGTTLEAVAREVGMSKTALYYYFPSKDALLFELIFGTYKSHAEGVEDAVAGAADGPDALRAMIRQSVWDFGSRLDDFRLAFLYGQASSPGSVHVSEEQFARIRPLNDVLLAGAAQKLAAVAGPNRAGVPPRLLAFLAHIAAIGLLTMKGMADSMEDPLIHSDNDLVEGLASVFAVAAEPAKHGDSA